MTSLGVEPLRAFVPAALPPEPPLSLSPDDLDLLDRAVDAVGRLAGLSSVLTAGSTVSAMFVRKEAVLSSRMDGALPSLADLLAHEIGEKTRVPLEEVQDLRNLVRAIEYGAQRLRQREPFSLPLLREIHALLLERGPPGEEAPGEFRRGNKWNGSVRPGDAVYVPPPPGRLPDCLEAFERFVQAPPPRIPPLVKAAMAHAQFANIQPFADGNGRLGRLLIPLVLGADGALSEQILYFSRYFKAHRDEYHERLQRVRLEGEWEEWIRFFLHGVLETAVHAMDTVRAMLGRFEADRVALQGLGRTAASVLLVHQALQSQPVLTVPKAGERTGLSLPTVTMCLERMIEAGMVREITGRRWGRLYAYAPLLHLLSEDEPPGGLPVA